MGFIAVIILAVSLAAVSSTQNGNSAFSDVCTNVLDTHRYGYSKFYHVADSGAQHANNTFMMRFMVRARSDAHILLSPTADPSDTDSVYEIVLGAGKNTFSDIRRSQRKGSKRTVRTPDLLSETELKTFWISMSKEGILGIGNWGDDQPFLFWQDTEPLLIRYFSFCTWNGVWGKWHFNCLNNNSTGQGEVEEVSRLLTTQEKLRRDLLTSYDPYVRPVIDADRLTTVWLDFECQHINLDEKRSVLSTNAKLSMSWQDEKIRWRKSDYGNITSLNVAHNEIWQPEIMLYNAANNGKALLGYAGMTVTSVGAVTWLTPAQIEAWCDLDLSRWPHDQQVCEIQLGVWSQKQLIDLAIVENGTRLNKQRTGSEWKVIELLAETTWIRSPWTDLDPDSDTEMPFSALILKVTLQRGGRAYHSILRVPLVVISILSLVSFWMTPLNPGKMAVLCLDLLLVSMFFLAVGLALPAQAGSVPRIVLVYCMGMTAVAIAIIISIFVIGLSRYAHSKAPPEIMYNFLCARPASFVLCLPQETKTYKELEDQGSGTKTDSQKIQQYWIILGTAIERITFFLLTIFWGVVWACL